ncbi:MAG: T9SS type A sorting domain-containing protein [Ignavibacteriaceae bacterium]|nr:T9SS type A sorting domain-containing protein [Ignavibacteriaceae bacterium]
MKKLFVTLIFFALNLHAQYTTPNTGVNWNLDSLVIYSGGVVTGSAGNYSISQLVTVSPQDIITVNAGAVVNFTATTGGFWVDGSLRVLGDSLNRITFTSPTPDSTGFYAGMRFNDSSYNKGSVVRYTDIYYADYGVRAIGGNPDIIGNYMFKCGRGIQLSSASPLILRNTIERSYEYGITLTLGSSPVIEWNTFINNNTQNTSPKNQISVGTQGNNSPSIRYNKILGGMFHRTGGISISALIGGSSSSSEIAYNEIYNNSFGIALGGGTLTCYVHHNKIYNNRLNPDAQVSGSGINVNGNSSNIPVIYANEIYNNWWGITIQNGTTIQAGPQPNIGNVENGVTTDDGMNMIYGNIQGSNVYDLFNNCSNDIYAQNNDWRVYDSIRIDSHIVHKTDDIARGLVKFVPFIDSTVIPVELSSLSAYVSGKSVVIEWVTATETNNLGFELFRESGNERVLAGKKDGSGTTLLPVRYSLTDIPVKTGLYRYILEQIDFDGSRKIAGVTEVNYDAPALSHKLSQNYPNPFNPSTTISFTVGGTLAQKVSLKVYDISGTEVAELFNGVKEPGIYDVVFDASVKAGLSSGVYLCELRIGTYSETRKLVLNK